MLPAHSFYSTIYQFPDSFTLTQNLSQEGRKMDQSSNDFAHEPLTGPNSKIRILSLLPGEINDDICCLLAPVDLKKQPKYEALSYCWGDSRKTKPIYVEHRSSLQSFAPRQWEISPALASQQVDKALRFKRLLVTKNLEAALRQLRFQYQVRDMWTDGICIDQQNTEEVSTQIQSMGQIYATASQVCVWLGRPSETLESRDGFNAPNVQAVFQYLRDLKERMTASDFDWKCAIHDRTGLPSSEIKHALEAICQQPWFFRVWVQQEHILAKSVLMHCGPEKMDFRDFGTTTRFIIRQFHRHRLEISPSLYGVMRVSGFVQMFQRNHFAKKPPGEKLLLSLLNTSGFLKASKHQDRVFGVLGLVHED
jgi:Heterokaryon incompatibility protein (HET)